MQNARFWVYANAGPVKLTLRPGQKLEHVEGGPHEEGWAREYTSWELSKNEPIVYREYSTDSQDCDGRHGTSGSDQAKLSELAVNDPYVPDNEAEETYRDVDYPNWTEHKSDQYDEFAVLAGY